ncbi:MAG TPA: FUSC family protein [Bryobacteraceae bacterium]|jgi:uncharacterized membrane protein YccC|nr:FUSC family protein [Bryobacteraceae bacterium]
MANAFWRTVLRFDRTRIAPEIAIRNTIGILIPLIAGDMTGHLAPGIVAALGAMNVSYSDSRDPYAARARRMFVASVMVGLAVTAGALSGHNTVLAIVTASLWAFAVGMLVVLGQRAGDLGAVTLMTLLVFAARSLSVPDALGSGLVAFGGGLLQMFLSIALWPVTPHEPERRIIASLYATLAEVAVSPAGSAAAPPASAPITSAQESLAAVAGDRSVEAERLIFLFNQAERIRLSLLSLRRLAKRIDRDPRGHAPATALHRILVEASAALLSISDGIPRSKQPAELKAFHDATREFRKRNYLVSDPPASDQRETSSTMFAALVRDANRQTDALAGQLRAAAGLGDEPRIAGVTLPRIDPFNRIGRLRANLSLQSTAFRHAVRLAVCVGIGDTIGRSLNIERSYWLPMTVAIVLKPDFTSTFTRGVLRIGGTLAGLLAATALFHFLSPGTGGDIALLAVFALAMRWIGPANYGILVSAVSGIVVLLIAMTGVAPSTAIVARAVNTIAGGTLALIAYWIWPTWETTRAGPVLADMLEASCAHFHEVFRLYAGVTNTKVNATRLPGRLARSNAEASVSRSGAEPGVSAAEASVLNDILVSSHAFVRAFMSIEASLNQEVPARPNAGILELAAKIELTVHAFAKALRYRSNLPDGLPDLRAEWTALQQPDQAKQLEDYSLLNVETDRIVTSLNTLRGQIVKWNKLR